MIHYIEFEQSVLSNAGEEGGKWKHVLPAVPLAFRYRFIFTLQKGFDIPASFDMVQLSQTLTDKNYDLFVQQALASKLSGDVHYDRTSERVSINE